jgi:hypothetical protein
LGILSAENNEEGIMNEINALYTTVSDGQLHIAADTKYIGSVDSYNNCFTQFFAWLFQVSIPVNFDGEVRSLNKNSYALLMKSLSCDDKIVDIAKCTMFRRVAEAAELPKSNLRMRDVIASSDRRELFQKLAFAISQGDTTRALLMIGKGAEIDTPYFERENFSPSFYADSDGLFAKTRYKIDVFHAAPILQAARKGNAVVCNFLIVAGANLSSVGEEYVFHREITKVDTRLEPAWILHNVPHYYTTVDSFGFVHRHVEYRLEYAWELQDRTYVTTQDTRTAKQFFQFDRDYTNYQK